MPSRINEREIALRSSSVGTFSTLKDYLDKIDIVSCPFNSYAFTGLSSAMGILIPSISLPAGSNLQKISLGTSSTLANKGGVVAATSLTFTSGTFTHGLETVLDFYGHILNLVDIRYSDSNDPVFDDNSKKVYGLILASSTCIDGDSIANSPNENLEISFVVYDNTDILVAPDGGVTGDIEISVNRAYAERYSAEVAMVGISRDIEILADLTKTNIATYKVVDSCEDSYQILNLSNGNLTGSGTDTGTSTPAKNYTNISNFLVNINAFNNNKTNFYRNGVLLNKGDEVEFNSGVRFNFKIYADELITIEASF